MPTESHVQVRSGDDAPIAPEAYALLAQANLLRMRGQWPQAVEKCMKALRLSPDNASAQSLLGDIYENQGLLDDAIQWYRMALDVCPDSPADKMKLARVVESKSRTLPPTPLGAAEPRRPRPAEPSATPEALLAAPIPANSDVLLRRAAYGAGGLTLLVILVALAFVHGGARVGKADRPLTLPNVVVGNSPTPASTSASPASAPPAPSAAPPSDPAEQDLLGALRGVPNLSVQGIAFTGVECDPRAGRLIVTVTCEFPTAAPNRDQVLRDAFQAAQAAVQVTGPEAYSQFTIRCLAAAPPAGGSTPLLLVADATRPAVTALPSDSSSPPSGQILSAFSNLWWSSVVAS